MKKIISLVLCMAMAFSFCFMAGSEPAYAGTTKTIELENIKCNSTGVSFQWKMVKNADKYKVFKNGKQVKLIKIGKKKKKKYSFNEGNDDYATDRYGLNLSSTDAYGVNAYKVVKKKQYYNKKTKKWQAKKPVKKYRGKSRIKKTDKMIAMGYVYEVGMDGIAAPVKADPAKYKAGRAQDIVYYTDSDGEKIGYKSFTLDSKKYYDVTDNRDVTTNTEFWKKVLRTKTPGGNTIQESWAKIADNLFESQGGMRTHYMTYADYYNGGGGKLNTDVDLNYLNQDSWGNPSRTGSMTSGLRSVSCLNDVRKLMAQQIVDKIDHNALDGNADKILEVCQLNQLKDTKTDRNVLCVVGTNIDERSTFGNYYRYSSNAIIFYDFALEPVIDENLPEISELSKYKTLEDAEKAGLLKISSNSKSTRIKNESGQDITSTVEVGTEEAETLSTQISNSKNISYGQSVETEFSWGEDDSFFHSSLKFGFTFGEAYESAKSEGKEITKTSSTARTVETVVPAHTAIDVITEESDKNVKYSFNVPMKVTYKVCVAAIAGKVYADDAAILSLDRERGSYVNYFGVGGGNGENAAESLDFRANARDSSYDDIYGKVYTYSHEENDKYTENVGVNWSAIFKDNMKNGTPSAINQMCNYIPIISNGGNATQKVSSTTFTVQEPIPMYNMELVMPEIDKQHDYNTIETKVGRTAYIRNYIKVKGYDKTDTEFYGFSQNDGYWVACDGKGNEIQNEDNEVFEVSEDGQSIKGKAPGEGFIKWVIEDDPEILKNYHGYLSAKEVTADSIKSTPVSVYVTE